MDDYDRLDHYDYHLPKHLIAQQPLPNRDDARLLVVDRRRGVFQHRQVRDLPHLLRPDDCVVLNDTRVIPARLLGYRTATGGRWEGLFLDADSHGVWRVMGRTRGKLRPEETITLVNLQGREDVQLRVGARNPDGTWLVRPESDEPPEQILDRVGRVPLPPYIRKGEMIDADREAYQTVFARKPGAVAAPTAGLHFTPRLLDRLRNAGVALCWITLHVGLGTFKPLESDRVSQHRMHAEWAEIGREAVDCILDCRRKGGRIVAVGSTSVRVLETAARGGQLEPFAGHTDLYIRPPYQFRIVDAMLTNFHLPRTTLLVLVRTFGGDRLIREAYEEAIREEYRFYSYGDAMLIL